MAEETLPEPLKEREALVHPAAHESEAFRTLRLALELRSGAREGSPILFTSPEKGEGKTTVAANFALVSSLNGSNVLLIDCDLRAPRLHECFGVPRSPGVIELLASYVSDLDKFVRSTSLFGRLDVLTAGRPVFRTSDLTSSARMGELLATAAAQYDLVVIDSPPVLVGADTDGLAAHLGVEVVLVVTPSTKRRALTRTLRRLELIEASIAGIVVNRDGRLPSKYRYY